MKISSGITAKTTQLAWTITLASLCLFIAFTIPGQKHDLTGGLESKGQSIAAGLEGEVASAAATDDYSSVVEHAMQIVAGDPAIEFIVISKSDGYSIIVERASWRIVPHIEAYWYTGARVDSTSIGVEPLIGKRVFHFRSPLDCMGMSWGWMHVGLSLNSYDKSVRQLYLRTGLVGVLCIALSLIASILFASRLVRPVLDLRQVVEKVAGGDLEARASIQSRDEIEQLGNAFNTMAEAILQRDRIVESVRFAAQSLQSTDEWDSAIDGVIARFGQAAAASRAVLVQIAVTPDQSIVPTVRLEWEAPGIAPYKQIWAGRTTGELGIEQRFAQLRHGHLLVARQSQIEEQPFICPDPLPRALIVAPIFAGDQVWGALCLQDCGNDREWGDVIQHSMRAIAEMVGASLLRTQAQQALVAAKDELEQRVAERTSELRDQIAAKDKAHSDLQHAQQKLIELSRFSGMAEVATGVLHNVGNALNSINVSASLISDRINGSRLKQLRELSTMLAEKNGELAEFLTADPRGRRAVPYLVKLSEQMQLEQSAVHTEAASLVKHVAHVKEIVAMQQGYARNCGVLEKVTAEELVENALSLSAPALDRHAVAIHRDYELVGIMMTDRHKILQILLNLLQNAKDAVKASSHRPREVFIRLRTAGPSRVRFEIEDNGIGIAPENLVRIFSHGFTTKRSGHGFGLHSGAIAATELGGVLSVASAGPGAGAVFTLELPLRAVSRAEAGDDIERHA